MRGGCRIKILLTFLLLVLGQPLGAEVPRSRLVFLKVDGLPPDLLAALAMPEKEEYWDRLPYADDLKRAVRYYRELSGRTILLPNIRHYFFEDGVYVENFYSETLTLSAAAWAVIDTGQPSVIKGHATFSRDTCYLRSHLDGLRDTIDAMKHGESKTAALWNLDQIGVSLILDAFDPERVWSGPQVYRRSANRELLLESGKRWVTNNESRIQSIATSHLSRLVTGIDYTEFAQEMSGFMTARKLLEKDLLGEEKYDYLSPLFTLMDHQQHVDPHPENLIHWSVKLDRLVGEIFRAVEQSTRKSATVVAMVSDHGSEIQPGKTAFSFPITKVFREPEFGSHTVKTLLVESAWNAVSVPLPGVDFPRVYESPYSPYGEKAGGEGGYVTCFIDNFGNGRSAVNLRNDDLNRLHLLLLAIKREKPGSERWEILVSKFQKTLEEARSWLEEHLSLLKDYQAGAADFATQLERKTDIYSLDVAWRIREELKRDAPQIEILERLLTLRFDDQCTTPGLDFRRVAAHDFQIAALIPKGFLGPPNEIRQLSHYTTGLDQNFNWVTTTVDEKGREINLDYYTVLSDYRAANAPENGDYNPFDLIVTHIIPEEIAPLLGEARTSDSGASLQHVVWVESTHQGSDRGGEALILEYIDGKITYLPVRSLEQLQDGSFSFLKSSGPDPLALLGPRGVIVPGERPRLDWVQRPHSRQEWLSATFQTEYGTAICMLLDILSDSSEAFIDSPDFQSFLTHFSSPQLKARYLRGLKRKYAMQQPDFVVWSDELWNFNSKARTSGGSHSGLRPICSRTAFLAWGGRDTGIARGKSVSEVATTLDLAPTLFKSLGMLDSRNHVIPRQGAIPERTFLPFPGKVVDIWATQDARPDLSVANQHGNPEK